MKLFLILSLTLAAAFGGWRLYQKQQQPVSVVAYRTAVVGRGTVVQSVRATGTVAPIKQVEVGTQVNGRIIRLYADFNSVVTANQVVAQIDPAVYQAAHARDLAHLRSNEAAVEQATARLLLAERELARRKELTARDILAPVELDVALAERDALAAQLKIAHAAVETSKAAIQLSSANLEYCTIRSPVDGVVIARNVDEGQTVVSSMSAQQLFQIATGLERIQVEASIPEADVGLIRVGQPVTFTVDAFPQTFTGEVRQIRLAAAMVQNVVTYPVIIEADNPETRLFPGMTANIAVEVSRRDNTLHVPAAALRFTPTNLTAEARGPRVWTLTGANGELEAVPIKTSVSDGTHIAIEQADAMEGREVVIGYQGVAGNSGPPRNPFMPVLPGSADARQLRRAMR